jgi:hypothetical protein
MAKFSKTRNMQLQQMTLVGHGAKHKSALAT